MRPRHGHYMRTARSRDHLRYVLINGGLLRCVYREPPFVLLCHPSPIGMPRMQICGWYAAIGHFKHYARRDRDHIYKQI